MLGEILTRIRFWRVLVIVEGIDDLEVVVMKIGEESDGF